MKICLVLCLAGCGLLDPPKPSTQREQVACAPGAGSNDIPSEVDQILAGKCRTCHASPPQFGAPMPLTSRADLLADASGGTVLDRVLLRIQDPDRPMPPAPNARLSTSEIAAIRDWASAGAPAGTGCAPISGAAALNCTPDLHIAPANSYRPNDGTETLVCYGFDAQVDGRRHITAFAPHIDDARVLHHLSLMIADEAVSATPRPCPSAFDMAKWRPVWGWTPGVDPLALPDQAGFPLAGTVHFVVQAHYAVPAGAGGMPDASGFDLCTTSTLRPHEADVMALGSEQIALPPNHSTELTCRYTWPFDDVHTIATLLHMHRRGLSMQAWKSSLDGAEDLGSQLHWDPEGHQNWIGVQHTIATGDIVSTRCKWRNADDHVVTFGETSEDEMCFAFVLYYPRTSDLIWNPALPALDSTCDPF